MKPIAAMLCGLTCAGFGLITNQPIGLMLGTVIANISYTQSVAAQQKKHTYSLQKSLEIQSNYHLEMDNVIRSMQLEIQGITVETEQAFDKKIVKLQNESKKVSDKTAQVSHKLQTVHTSNRLLLSEVKQLQQQLKVKSALIASQQQQLAQLSIKVNPPVIETKPEKKMSPLPTPITKTPTFTHVYIDGNNLTKTAQELNFEIDWKALKNEIFELAQGTDSFILKYYTGMPDNLTFRQKAQFNELKQLKYEVIPFYLSKRENGNWKTEGDDMAIGLDLIEVVKLGDRVILVTGDGDFIPLVKKLMARKIEVIVIGSLSNTSSRLQQLLQKDFISLESIRSNIVQLKALKTA